MRELHHARHAVSLASGIAVTMGCTDAPPAPEFTAADDTEAQLDELGLVGNDAGVHVALDAVDRKRVRASGPPHKNILDIIASRSVRGLELTELRFESAELSPEEALSLFPPGDDVFQGITTENAVVWRRFSITRFVGTGFLHAGRRCGGRPWWGGGRVVGWSTCADIMSRAVHS